MGYNSAIKYILIFCKETLEDIKVVIRTTEKKTIQCWKGKEQAIIYKTLQRKLMIEQHGTHITTEWTKVLGKGKQFLSHQWHLK